MADGRGAYGEGSLVQISTGERRALPASATATRSSERTDAWYAGALVSAPLVRVDDQANVDLFDARTLARVGGFDPSRLDGTDQPEWYSPLLPSPDGRYLLGYWKRNYRQADAALTVFDLTGRVMQSGSPYEYDRFFLRNAIGWLADGRYVYLAGKAVVVADLHGVHTPLGQLPLPANVSVNGAVIHPSPDGKMLLMELHTSLLTASGSEVVHTLLYRANLDGTGFSALTALTARDQDSLLDFHHVRSAWAPDGRSIVFSVRSVAAANNTEFGWLVKSCSPVFQIPADAQARPITREPMPATLDVPDGGTAKPLASCLTFGMQWLSEP